MIRQSSESSTAKHWANSSGLGLLLTEVQSNEV